MKTMPPCELQGLFFENLCKDINHSHTAYFLRNKEIIKNEEISAKRKKIFETSKAYPRAPVDDDSYWRHHMFYIRILL